MTAEATLRQLRYFAVLGAELNYRRAAEQLFISQPALSSVIKQLERQLLVEVDATMASLVTLSRTTTPCCASAT